MCARSVLTKLRKIMFVKGQILWMKQLNVWAYGLAISFYVVLCMLDKIMLFDEEFDFIT